MNNLGDKEEIDMAIEEIRDTLNSEERWNKILNAPGVCTGIVDFLLELIDEIRKDKLTEEQWW